MAQYRFEAVTYSGKTEKGIVDADSIKSAKNYLLSKQLAPLHIELASQSDRNHWLRNYIEKRQKLSTGELAMLTRQLALLIKSGLPIDEALLILSEETSKKNVKETIKRISSEVRSGMPLSKALGTQTQNFDKLYQGIVAAAEQSGRMSQVLNQLAIFLEKKEALKQKAMGALIYPLMLTGVSLMVIIFLMTYVVPQITKVFESSKQTLPLLTKMIMGASHFINDWGWLFIIICLFSIVLIKRILSIPEYKFKFDQWCLNFPGMGSLILSFETARFASTLSMLTGANVAILAALQSSSETLRNNVLKNAITITIQRLKEGATLSRALGSQAVFSPILIHLIRTGESSGKLSEMLQYAADNAENEAERRTKIMSNLLEPTLILLMGLIVLVIVLAVMQPILEMNHGIR
jgi:general secretion pathway protein F